MLKKVTLEKDFQIMCLWLKSKKQQQQNRKSNIKTLAGAWN